MKPKTIAFDKAQTKVIKIPYTTAKKRVFKTTLKDLSIGQNVIYWEVLGDDGPKCEPLKTSITSEVWEACGSTLVKVDSKRGGVCIEHIQLVPK